MIFKLQQEFWKVNEICLRRIFPKTDLETNILNLEKAIYKTSNTGMGNRMRGMQGTRGMFTRIPGNILEDSGEYSHFSIPGNAQKDSGQCSRRFQGMFKKILWNLNFDLCLEILLVFYQILLLNCYKTMEKNNCSAILLKKTFSSLRLVTSLLRLITIFLT